MANYRGAVRNTQRGIRGLNTVAGYRDLAPGETATVELTEAEHASAKGTGYFEFGAAAEAGSGEGGDDLDVTVAKLKEIAAAENVELGGATSKADIQAAIRSARAAAAAPKAQADDLDNMNDDDLRNTAAALAGKPVAELADLGRDALLMLARGQ